jgi:hypothetical protein
MLVKHEFCRKKLVKYFSNTLSGQSTRLSMKKNFCSAVVMFAACAMSGIGYAQVTLTDLGASNPTPGPNDISQLSTAGNQTNPDGLNYYTDDHVGYHNGGEPGQTFTTGTNSAGYVLTSVSIKTGGLDSYSNIGTATSYYLHIYSVSGSTATLIQTYSATISSFKDGDWLRWSGFYFSLAANTTYAWSFGLVSDTGWEAMAVASSNPYSGGQIALIPPAGGTMTFGSSHAFDAVFDLGLSLAGPLIAGTPVSNTNNIYIGSSVTLTSSVSGTLPYFYQWQTDGGSGVLTNIPNATNAIVTVTPPRTGSIQFGFVVTNSSGSATSGVAVVTVNPLPGTANIYVNVSQSLVASLPSTGIGAATAVYENSLADSASCAISVPESKAAGIGAFRFPGGSYADIYNWRLNTYEPGLNAYINSVNTFANFMNRLVIPAGATAIVTCNYGSDNFGTNGMATNDIAEAAAWVAYANVTNHWAIKYWEIGNEVGGNGYYGTTLNWETDLHYPETNATTRVGQPALSPAAYGTNSIQFVSAMKAVDPTIKCGVGFDTGNSTYNSQLLGVCGSVVDFVIIHYYPSGTGTNLLSQSTQIPSMVNNTYTQLTNIVGATHASQMQIAVTETGAGNNTGPVVSLFAADNYLTWLENGVANVDYQEFHSDILLEYPSAPYTNQQPAHAYYGVQMTHLLANVGDTLLKATSDFGELHVHATARQDGKVGVMLMNMDPVTTSSVTVNISGATLASSGTWYQFGLTNFISTNDVPTWPVYSNTVSGLGNQFTVSVPPYTMIDLIIPSANTPPVLAAISNQTVNVGQTVAFTASATDTDQPPQTLTFSLLSGISSATLNTNSGAFSWRPAGTNANTTNTFTLKVADNGSPIMSATQSFSVMVNPLTQPTAASIALSNGKLGFQVSGQAGPDYAVQVSSNLLNWSTPFITNSPAMPFSWTDTNAATLPVQFYRIKVGPPLP